MGLELVLQPFGRYRDEIRFFLASVADRITDDWPNPAGLGPDVDGGVARAARTDSRHRAEMVDGSRGSAAPREQREGTRRRREVA